MEYEALEIASLVPGSYRVSFKGRIANFYDQPTPSKMPLAAKGCIKVIVKDDTAALTVRLWYGNDPYVLRLGQLCQVWTSHISDGTTNSFSSSRTPLVVSIFPRRDRHCHFTLPDETNNEKSLCKRPLGYRDRQPLDALMTLKSYVEGGYEVPDAKILVCVKSIGAKKKITSRQGDTHTLVKVGIFDDTASASLTLWSSAAASVDVWSPSFTVLLISGASCRTDRNISVSLTSGTLVDVDPYIPDADWLRKKAQKLTRRDHVNPACPEEVFDLETALTSELRILYTLADVDEFVRAAPDGMFIGFLSALILNLHINTLHLRNMLLCNECCGVPIFANVPSCPCKQCGNAVTLRLNPRIVGTLVDETGAVSAGKLLWTDEAWTQLLGRDVEALVAASGDVRRALERRLECGRVCLVFGWPGEDRAGGRLCVLGVRA